MYSHTNNVIESLTFRSARISYKSRILQFDAYEYTYRYCWTECVSGSKYTAFDNISCMSSQAFTNKFVML
jgi:hypothetical protein